MYYYMAIGIYKNIILFYDKSAERNIITKQLMIL